MTGFTVFRNFGKYTIKEDGDKYFVYREGKPAGFYKDYSEAKLRIEQLTKRYDN